MREWVARFRFPDKAEAYFGTVRAESEMQAEQAAFALWKTIMPIEPPSVFTMVPGSIRLELNA